MDKEMLLKPRWEVIADYPGNVLPIGLIMEMQENAHDLGNLFFSYEDDGTQYALTEKQLNRHPHLFKKLAWWEEREESEMPQYLQDIENPTIVYKVYGWLQNNAMFYFKDNEDCVTHTEYFKAITETEYNSYINKSIQ